MHLYPCLERNFAASQNDKNGYYLRVIYILAQKYEVNAIISE